MRRDINLLNFWAFLRISSNVISIWKHKPADSEFTAVDNLGHFENLKEFDYL